MAQTRQHPAYDLAHALGELANSCKNTSKHLRGFHDSRADFEGPLDALQKLRCQELSASATAKLNNGASFAEVISETLASSVADAIPQWQIDKDDARLPGLRDSIGRAEQWIARAREALKQNGGEPLDRTTSPGLAASTRRSIELNRRIQSVQLPIVDMMLMLPGLVWFNDDLSGEGDRLNTDAAYFELASKDLFAILETEGATPPERAHDIESMATAIANKLKQPTKRRRRRPPSDVEADQDIQSRWGKFRDAGGTKIQFAKDKGISLSDLEKTLDRVRKRCSSEFLSQ